MILLTITAGEFIGWLCVAAGFTIAYLLTVFSSRHARKVEEEEAKKWAEEIKTINEELEKKDTGITGF